MKNNLKRFTCLLMSVVLSVTMVAYAAPQAAAASSAIVGAGKTVLTSFVSSAVDKIVDYICGDGSESEVLAYFMTPTASTAYHYPVSTEGLMSIRNDLLDAGVKCSLQKHTSGTFYYIMCTDRTLGGGGGRTSSSFRTPSTSIAGLGFACDGMLVVAYSDATVTDDDATARKNIWLPFSTAVSKKQVSVLTKDSLSDLCVTVNQTDRTCSVRDTFINDQRFYVIIDTSNNIYANADGVPYVAHYEPTATNNKYDYIIQ